MREENKKKSEGSISTFLTLINNRITSNILIYFISILLIINAYILGGMVSIKNRPANSLFISDYDINNITSSTTASTSQESEMDNKIIFGSSKGKYYYYKGCEATNLSPKNLVYYKSEVEAKSLGKILHSSCQ